MNKCVDSNSKALTPILLQDIENQDTIKGISQEIVLVDSYPVILCSGKKKGKE